jgi:23S rRNA (adenine1618-N6)-methyltransferase
MLPEKREHPKEKSSLHPRNKHRERYDFKQLIASCPQLAPFVALNKFEDESIDFFNPEAVKMLNTALLKHFYGINFWEIPKDYLCPPIPGRADYLHYMADLLGSSAPKLRKGNPPTGASIKCLDIGVGANGVYPIIGVTEYGWTFVGTEIDPIAIESATKIVAMNPSLQGKVDLRMQSNTKSIFKGSIQKDELFDLTVCNPPFHASLEEAQSSTVRKLRNLTHKKVKKPVLNFGGQSSELWCEGGEERFVDDMIHESKTFATSCFWFSTLISKEEHLKNAYRALQKVQAIDVRILPMGQGNKVSRILAWTFLDQEQQKKWITSRWN